MPILGFIMGLAFIGACTYAIVTVARLFAGRRAGLRGRGPELPALEERLARLEQAVEGLSVESQRLIEGHRFFTQLMSQRPPPAVGSGTASNADAQSRAR